MRHFRTTQPLRKGIFNILKSIIEEHARLDFSDFLSTLLVIFHLLHEKFHPARLLIYLVKNRQGEFFSKPACLFRSARLFGTSEFIEYLKKHIFKSNTYSSFINLHSILSYFQNEIENLNSKMSINQLQPDDS